MGFFNIFQAPDMEKGLREYKTTSGAILLDVRTKEEFLEGHVPGSMNLPLQEIDRIGSVSADKKTPLFVYCYSGARSSQAVKALEKRGYENVKNIGGISGYRGKWNSR